MEPDDLQIKKAETFKKLHESPGIFLMPNPWDAGSAKLLETLGYRALATTSAGLAFSLAKADGAHPGSFQKVSREDTLANIRGIAGATTLPLSGDLENGFGDAPELCAETILLSASAGLVGGSVEDATGLENDPIYPFRLAVERVKAACAAARGLSFPFMVTARAENLIQGINDLKDTIARLEAFADAGADVLFAPGLKTREEIALAVKAIAPRPLSVLMGLAGCALSVSELEDLGVRRVSIGSSLARAAYTAFLAASKEMMEKGTFTYADNLVPFAKFNEIFKTRP